ncbi:coiled-coil domain-containing protein [Geomonas azotofigens]|uniref:hypothetical protein n=1 Tax=Geomonas azotofigens TaxID=2843196 RepID=UPI001C0F59B5|nr:hypothetical protein [Geomonas azotofigens]MBU5614416.1 hypothetical protein [Geomonas azotofigens]
MEWELEVNNAELLLRSTVIPSSERIITAIKKVNPTRLCLPDPEKKQGYRLKSQLQNLLLEHYGEVFQLIPHPCSPNVVLIKHLFLPTVDACHADLGALSAPALDTVATLGPVVSETSGKRKRAHKGSATTASPTSPRDCLKRAQQLLDDYDYIGAELEVAAMRANTSRDVPTLCSGILILCHHIGAYQTAIDTLLAQPPHILKEKGVRELLALAYHRNAMPAEAGAVFDSLHPSDLGKEALHAYACLSFKDGNPSFALHLVGMAEGKDGLIPGLDVLRKEIEEVLSRKVEPVLQRAEAELSRGELDRALTLAREALTARVDLPKARRIIALVEDMKEKAEVTALWQAFERSSESKERQRLLTKLLEQDKSSSARINALLQLERSRERRETIDNRLQALKQALRDEKWPECLEAILWLSRQKDAAQEYRNAVSMSPLFTVLYRNSQIDRLSRHDAQEAWLSYVEAKSLLAAGRDREAFLLLQKVRPVFRTALSFGREYEAVLTALRAEATEETDRLLADVGTGALAYGEALTRWNSARATLDILTERQRSTYVAAMDKLLEQLRPHKGGEALLEEYREALMTGQTARAAALRELVVDPAAVAAVEAEINVLMSIDVVPVALSLSPEMEVDMTRDNAGLKPVGSTERHLFLYETETSVLFIDFVEMTAWRLRSPRFHGLCLADAIADRHLFLFLEVGTSRYWRAIIKGRESRFTAFIDFSQALCLPENTTVPRAYLSSSKETEYFYALKNVDNDKVLCMGRMTVGLGRNSGPACNFRTETIEGIARASSDPDYFALGTQTDMWLSNRNLRTPNKFPRPWHVFGFDQRNRMIYFIDTPRLKACDFKWGLVKDYTHALSIGMYSGSAVRGICPETSTLLLTFKKGRGLFYNLETNQFSSQFNVSSVICPDIPSRWYYMEYCQQTSSIRLKDITGEIDGLLQWEEVMRLADVKKLPRKNLVDPLRRIMKGEDVVGKDKGPSLTKDVNPHTFPESSE